MAKLLFFAGSTRKDSLNKKLAKLAAKLAEKQGAETEFIDLSDFAMPLYDGDLEQEQGLPDTAIALKEKFKQADGFFIASPEYNSSFSAVLKNTIDWISRPHTENEPSLVAYKGKVVAVGAVSPGPLGGIRGLVPLKMLFGNISMHVVPSQVAVGDGFQAFDEKGELKDDRARGFLESTVKQLVDTAKLLKS